MSRQPSPEIVAAARKASKAWGVPASVQLAQFALESAWGARTSGDFNYFGMKAKPGQPSTIVTTHEVYRGQRVQIQAAFRKFGSAAEAFDAHAKLLATGAAYGRFRSALAERRTLAEAVATLGGGTPARPAYATDPEYGPKLMAIISGSKLTAYDA